MPKVGPGAKPPPPKKAPPPKKGAPPSPKKPPPGIGPGIKIGEVSTVAIPAKYQSWVATAAKETGIPESVVAAQINLESGFNPNATSPTGAQGIAQFEPGTWHDEGCQGSAYNAADALLCYIKLLRQLLKLEKGNLRNALAAYNAGPGDLAAGYGYADEILGVSGGGTAVSPSGLQIGTVTLPVLPSTGQDSWADVIGQANQRFLMGGTALAKHRAAINDTIGIKKAYYNG
jgi:hypothetical protein